MELLKSNFEGIVQEDFNEYRSIAKRFKDVSMVDLEELRLLTIDSWLLATRWSEIQSNAVKISTEYDVNKTDFSTWAYQKYRQLQELHITARTWYRQARDEYVANNMLGGVDT